jgi:SSS family solute:Na+ symporter
MLLGLSIILLYFVVIMVIGVRGRLKKDVGAEEYFLSSRSLNWPYIAASTIATNIQASHFIAMAGSAYIFGLAQANLEINAIFGILVSAFIFVPLYLRMRVFTITQFFEFKLGPNIALAYSILMILLYSLSYLGTALFWAAYAIDGIFGELFHFLNSNSAIRLCILIVLTGLFSSIYTYLGGLRAVVRTDVVQFSLLVIAGLITLFVSIHHLGGWSKLWTTTGDLMHLHLPSNHPTLPWVGIIGMLLLDLNYWGANQVILQRALAAKDLRNAQIGLLVGGTLKYLMALIIIIPAIALSGILRDHPLKDPDLTFITIVNDFMPSGIRGLILTGLFASIMSTLDSIYNSVATLWSIDIYKRHLRPEAKESEIVRSGRLSIIASLIAGTLFGFVVVYVKLGNPTFPLTHWFNELSYYVKNSIVLIISAAVFLVRPSRRLVLFIMLFSVFLNISIKTALPDMNYFVRSAWVIVISFAMVAVPTVVRNGWNLQKDGLLVISTNFVAKFGVLLAVSLIAVHIIFH